MPAEGTQAELDATVRGKGKADVTADAVHERLGALKAKQERLQKQVHHLRGENANHEVNIMQMEKHCDGDHKELQGLNIALDLKQQELKLVSPTHLSPYAWFRG